MWYAIYSIEQWSQAVCYSTIKTECTGAAEYAKVKKSDVKDLDFAADNSGFDLSKLTTGHTGKPVLAETKEEFKKLVIADKWKPTANNDDQTDELVWIIKTSEGAYVKMMVSDFPAAPAPTATGFVAIEWELLK